MAIEAKGLFNDLSNIVGGFGEFGESSATNPNNDIPQIKTALGKVNGLLNVQAARLEQAERRANMALMGVAALAALVVLALAYMAMAGGGKK